MIIDYTNMYMLIELQINCNNIKNFRIDYSSSCIVTQNLLHRRYLTP